MPKRIQRKRTKGWRMPPNTVYVGRPTKWGNMYAVGDPNITSNQDAVDAYTRYLMQAPRETWTWKDIDELAGKDLACWCPLDQPCHADILLKLANDKE